MAEDKKESIIGNIICRAKKLAFSYFLTEKDRRDWLQGGYRDRLYDRLSKLTSPELEEASQWTDGQILDVIEPIVRPKTEEWATATAIEMAEDHWPSRDSSQEPLVDRLANLSERMAQINNIKADTELKKKLGKFFER